MKISGNLIDIILRQIYPAEISFKNGLITGIRRLHEEERYYIMPGLIDSHVHIESSMVTPGAFAGAAVSRGTVATVSDPHEIANVLGIEGVKFMIRDAEKVPLKFYFGAPSCVPATTFETSGATVGSWEIEQLMAMDKIKYLSEMMNFPGVIHDDPEVVRKIEIAKRYKKPVDGHAPGLAGEMLRKYVSAGISTDHECTTISEAKEKIGLGMKVLIREGSAARNMNELKELVRTNPEMVMLCSDDIHPEMLAKRHINKLVADLLADGFDLFDVLRSCTLNPAKHYKLEAGLLRQGDPADFIITSDFNIMDVLETWIGGEKVFDRGRVLFNYQGSESANKFNCSEITQEEISIKNKYEGKGGIIRVIEALDGELTTREVPVNSGGTGIIASDVNNDILKLVVKDRYNDSPPAVAFIKGFNLKAGAFASSVAHDSHNIIAAGTNDNDITGAINEIVRMKGGLAVCEGNVKSTLQLGIAGIMSDRPIEEVASRYEQLSETVKSLGCKMSSPFMTLSFKALLVIPELKLSDRGLFDVRSFRHVPLFIE